MSFRDTVALRLEKWMSDNKIKGEFYENYIINDRGDDIFIIQLADPSSGLAIPTLQELRNINIEELITKKDLKNRREKKFSTPEIAQLEPEEGDIIYNTTTKVMQFWNGARWLQLASF